MLFVMPGLPDAHGRSVRLDLIDVASLDPHRLALDDGLLHDDGLGHDGLLDDDRLRHDGGRRHDRRRGLDDNGLGVVRTGKRRSDHATDDSADEARPEVASARAPMAPMVMVVAMVKTAVVKTPVIRPGDRRPGRQNHTCRQNDGHFDHLVHFIPAFPDFSSCIIPF